MPNAYIRAQIYIREGSTIMFDDEMLEWEHKFILVTSPGYESALVCKYFFLKRRE